uniref:PRELI domain containing 1b n=1 Tax=Cyprinus carpio TaxID=7962 RepID=A0A8C1NP87_CYPCA
MIGKHFFSETDIKSTWEQVLTAFWQRYPNPYSTHVLTEDVLFREVTSDNLLLSRRLLTKTNRLPRWAERIFPGKRSVYIIEDSVVDLGNRSLTTLTWNVNHAKLMTLQTDINIRECSADMIVSIMSVVLQEFGLARFRSNQVKSMKGLEHALSNLQSKSSVHSKHGQEHAQKQINKRSKKPERAHIHMIQCKIKPI